MARTAKAQRLTGKTRAISPGEGETHIAQKGQWMLQDFQGLGASFRLASGLGFSVWVYSLQLCVFRAVVSAGCSSNPTHHDGQW